MSRSHPIKSFTSFTGLTYAGLLATTAFVCAGAGHGTYIPVLISSAPLGFAGGIPAFIGIFVLWTGVGIVVDLMNPTMSKRVVWALLAVHYSSALVFMIPTFGYADWNYIRPYMTPALVLWVTVYGAGQVLIWRRV